MENVVGLATFNAGEYLEGMTSVFTSLGYSTDWRILNAAHFGGTAKRNDDNDRARGRSTNNVPLSNHYCNRDTIGYRESLSRPARSVYLQLSPLVPG